MKYVRRAHSNVLLLLVVALILTACQSVAAPSSGPLIVLVDNDEGPITPANFNTFIGFWMVGWVYDPLFVRSPELSWRKPV